MTEAETLHTAVRRCCRARHDECWEAFRALELRLSRAGRGAWKNDVYTIPEADLFSRVLVLRAILFEVERHDPVAFGSAEAMRHELLRVASDAQCEFLPEPSSAPEERRTLSEFINSLSACSADVNPLPFRRVLTAKACSRVWEGLATRWRIRERWYPLGSADAPPHTLAFHTDYFDETKSDVLRRVLTSSGVHRVWELRYSIALEIDTASFEPSFSSSDGSTTLYGAGEEAFWTGPDFDWLVYASHENSITLSGEWLLDCFEAAFPECRELTFLGQISTPDLRGTW